MPTIEDIYTVVTEETINVTVTEPEAINVSFDSAIATTSWGLITGTLSNQTDLVAALALKANASDLSTHTGNATIHFTDASVLHNNRSDLQGGTSAKYYHLTDTQHTIATQAASGSQAGYLSSSDWTAFNGKQPLLISGTNIKTINSTSLLGSGDIAITGVTDHGALTGLSDDDHPQYSKTSVEASTAAGQLPFGDGAGGWDHTETSEFVWDDTNKRVGIGTATPAYKFHLLGGQGYFAGTGNGTGILFPSWLIQQSAANNLWIGSTSNYNFGIGYGIIPRRRLDVLDNSNPQFRITHTDNSVYAEMQALATGELQIDTTASGAKATFTQSMIHASDNEVAYKFQYTTNKAAGNDAGIVLNQIDTSSPGTSLLFDGQVGGVSKYYIVNTGATFSSSSQTAAYFISNSSNPGSHSGAFRYIQTIASTANQNIVNISPTYNQASGSASNTDLLINRTETAVGSGTQLLFDGQVGGVSKASISNTGSIKSATLTAGRVLIAGASKEITDDSDLTFSSDTLTATKLSAGTLTHTGARIANKTTVNAATYDVLATDYILHVTYTGTGTVSIDLKTAQVVAGRMIWIKDAGGGASTYPITVTTEGSETIDGAATAVLNTNYESIGLYCDGSNWFII